MTYQPVWRDGIEDPTKRVDRPDSHARFEVIASEIDQRPGVTTVLDLGAAEGYFAARLEDRFNCLVTAIDDNPVLRDLQSPNIQVMSRKVGWKFLAALGRHDVVLALSVLHHFKDWRAVLRGVVACREFAIIELPHPAERWMRMAPGRHELAGLHEAVSSQPGAVKIAEHERTGRDGSRHMRPMFRVPGTVRQVVGTVFSGSGTCSRKLPEHGKGLDRHLGYAPFPGSLNLKLDRHIDLGVPTVDWRGKNTRGKSRDYQFWNAWLAGNEVPVHAMVPGRRGHGPDHVELVSPVKLRTELGLDDGAEVQVDIEIGGRRGRA